MQKVSVIVSSIILLGYYIFTSGIVYELIQSSNTDKFDIPYSIGLSAERTGSAVVTYSDDFECTEWLNSNWDKETQILADYNGAKIVNTKLGILQGENYMWGNEPIPWSEAVLSKCYIFKTTWNAEKSKYVYGTGTGLRKLYDWPECNYPIVFQSGKSIIYKTY